MPTSKARLRDLSEAVRETAHRNNMFVPGGTVVAAISGGPDSTALLHALVHLAPELDIRIEAAHFEHGIRGQESLDDASFAVELGERLGVKVHAEHADIPAAARSCGLSVMQAARIKRHEFLRRVAASVCTAGTERIAIAHTSDDRAETILLNILRGTGTEGLAAMPPCAFPIVRPIIDVRRSDVEQYCARNHLNPRIDSSNSNPDYTRNKLRLELLPHLAAYYNPGVVDALLRLGDVAAQEKSALDAVARGILEAATIRAGDTELVLDAGLLAKAPIALQRRAVRTAIERVRGCLEDVDLESIDSLLHAVRADRTEERTLPSSGGLEVHVRYADGLMTVFRRAPRNTAQPYSVELPVPGLVQLPAGYGRVSAEIVGTHDLEELSKETSRSRCIFPLSAATGRLLVRSWRAGDRMRQKGLAGTKKLQDLYTDCRVRSSERCRYPVLAMEGPDNRILAVLGLRADQSSVSEIEAVQLLGQDPGAELLIVRFDAPDASVE